MQRPSTAQIALAVAIALPVVAVVAALGLDDRGDPSSAIEAAAERMPRFESATRPEDPPLSSTALRPSRGAAGTSGGADRILEPTAGEPCGALLGALSPGRIALRVLRGGEARLLGLRLARALVGEGAHVYLAPSFLELRGHALAAEGQRVERPVRISAAEGWPAAAALLSVLEGREAHVLVEPEVEAQRLVHLLDALRARRPVGEREDVRIQVALTAPRG